MKTLISITLTPWSLTAFLICVTPWLLFSAGSAQQHSYVPKQGFVPDEKTAVRIAEAVLDPIYGEEKINSEKPFSAKLNDQSVTWTISGHMRAQYNKGGVALVEIAKSDGRILRVTHGK